jgi:hypothetical protein
LRPKAILVLLAVAGSALSLTLADLSVFVPKSVGSGAYLDLFGSFEEDDSRSSSRTFGWTDTFVKEKLTLYSNGYLYHPRFLQYRLSVAGALKQEKYQPSYYDRPLGWQRASGIEYDGKLLFLADHPYTLELFASRYEPLFKDEAATRHNSVATRQGGLFRYRRRPYLFRADFSKGTNRSASSYSEVTRFGVDGEYLKQYRNGNQFSLRAGYTPSRFASSSGVEGHSTESLFSSFVDLQRARLESGVTRNSRDQEDRVSGRFESDQFAWYERLSAYLPLNLRSDISYRYQNNENTFPGEDASGRHKLSDIGKDLELNIDHRLYQSLVSRYTFFDRSRESSGGDSSFTSHALAFDYNKTIPRGKILAALSFSRGDSDNRGRADVVDELHAAAVGGAFSLGRQNVEPLSLVVFLKSPLPPFQTVRLEKNVDYVVAPLLNTLEISVLRVPPEFEVAGTTDYDFLVSYSLTTDRFELRTETVAHSASVELLDNQLTPYYSYVAVRSTTLSGVLPGGPLDSTTYTTGLRFQSGPLRGLGEFQYLKWDVSPYRAWRVEVQYVGPLNPTTTVYGTVSYLNKRYPQGTSLQLREAYTDERESVTGSLRKQLSPRGLMLSAGGSVSRWQGRIRSDAYALNSSLDWKIGKLALSAGASAYLSQTEDGVILSNRRFHQYYYVSARRELF